MVGLAFAFSNNTANGGNLNSEKLISFSWLESKKPALIPLSSADWAEAVRHRDDMAIVNRYFIIDVGFSQ
jgi:hypothetical protein